MRKTFALITLLLSQLAFAKVLDQKDCAHLLKSYEHQRSGADRKLVTSIREHSRQIHEQLLDTKLGKAVTATVRGLKPIFTQRSVLSLSDEQELIIRQENFDSNWELLEKRKSEPASEAGILLYSRDISDVPELAFETFKLSPDKTHVALQYRAFGEIDNSYIMIYNLADRRVVGSFEGTYDFAWISPTRILFDNLRQNDESEYGVRAYDLTQKKTFTWSRTGSVSSTVKDWVLTYKGSQQVLHHQGNEYELPGDALHGSLFGADDKYLYFKTTNHTWSNGKVYRLEIASLERSEVKFQDLIPENAYRLADVGFKEGYIFLERSFGEHHDVSVYKADGSFVGNAEVPVGANVTDWGWDKLGEVLRLKLSNPVRPSFVALFDLQTKTYQQDLEQELLVDERGTPFASCVIYATSADGVKVPVRLFYKKMGRSNPCSSSSAGKKRPVLIESYGGFFLGGNFRDSYDHMAKEFLDHGGILVGPALRGGNEFGGSWHSSGQLLNKANTLNDLIATAEELIRRGITTPNLISSMGTSNGGFVVAAATSQRPDLFGLTIPINGVLDWENSQELDPTFKGWKYEYGDTSKDEFKALRTKLSPTKLASTTTYQNILVITGLNDSRVNPAHSYNFVQAAEEGPTPKENINWLAVKNTGHWGASLPRQGHTARHIQSVIWTAIYKQSGFKN